MPLLIVQMEGPTGIAKQFVSPMKEGDAWRVACHNEKLCKSLEMARSCERPISGFASAIAVQNPSIVDGARPSLKSFKGKSATVTDEQIGELCVLSQSVKIFIVAVYILRVDSR